MEWVFIIALIISFFAGIYMQFGVGVFILIVAAIILGIRWLIKTSNAKEIENSLKSDYVKCAWSFIEFYEKLPKKDSLIITPELIGVIIGGDEFYLSTYAYLASAKSEPQLASILENKYLKENEAYLGYESGVRLYRKLGLNVKLHNDALPLVFMPLYCLSYQVGEKYRKAIKLQYKKTYGRELELKYLEFY